MANLLIGVMILLYTFQSAFANLFARHYAGKKAYSSAVYSVIYGLFVSLGTLIFAGFAYHPSRTTLILGAVNGAALVLYNTLLIRAASLGPFSVTMIFNLSGGILLPMLWSVLHDGETLSVWQILAILVMLVSFVFLNWEEKKPGEKKESVSLPFLLTITALGCVNGLYGTLMNTAEKLAEGLENKEMIITTFFVSALLGLLLLAVQAKKDTLSAFRTGWKAALWALLASASACAAVNLLMYVLSLVNVAVLYAMDNGGVLIVSVLWSAVILKEKLGGKKIVGLVLSIAAIVALSIL